MAFSRTIVLAQNIAPRRLPVWRTVGECYALVGRNLVQLLRISWLPLLLVLLANSLCGWLFSRWLSDEGGLTGFARELLLLLSSSTRLPFLASIAVAWHRLILRGEAVSGWFYLRLDRVVWQYAFVCFLLNLLLLSPAGRSGAVLGGLLILLLILPRLSLVLPAIALGRNLPPTEAWRASKGNTWRLAWASLLCLFPPLLLIGAAMVAAERGADVPKALAVQMGDALITLATVVSVSLLSLAFDFLVRQRDPARLMPA